MKERVSSKPTKKKCYRWITPKFGSVDNLELKECEIDPPGSDEVRISVRAVGLNFADVFTVLGLYTAAGPTPVTPGLEISGVIDSIGDNVTNLKPGDQVVGVTRFGGYSTAVNLPQQYIRPIETGWSFAEGAAFPVQAITAYYSIVVLGGLLPRGWKRRRGEVFLGEDGGNVLIHSIAGGVGLIAAEIASKCGAHIIGTIGRKEKLPILKERLRLSRDQIIVRGNKEDANKLKSIANERRQRDGSNAGFELILDSVGGKYFDLGYDALKPGGRHIIFGAASMMPQKTLNVFSLVGLLGWIRLAWQMIFRPRLDPLKMVSQNKTVSGFNLIWLYDRKEILDLWDEILSLKLSKPLVGKEYDFRGVKDAMKYFQSGQSIGKVCLIVPEDLQF